MSNTRWERIQNLYHATLERPASTRAEFLRHACEGDPAMLHEVQSLLAQPISAAGFLASGALAANDDTLSARVGWQFGAYVVQELIGRGGMGEVYRATDTKLKRQVAIKILPPSLAADHDGLVRFRREAEVLASLNHPHVAAIYGLEESEGS